MVVRLRDGEVDPGIGAGVSMSARPDALAQRQEKT